jgi:hypothetical protein
LISQRFYNRNEPLIAPHQLQQRVAVRVFRAAASVTDSSHWRFCKTESTEVRLQLSDLIADGNREGSAAASASKGAQPRQGGNIPRLAEYWSRRAAHENVLAQR